MKRFLIALALAACSSPAARSAPVAPIETNGDVARSCPSTPATIPFSPPKVDEISIEQLALVFPKKKLVVGFDVDDTLVFSAPAFNELEPQYPPEIIRPKSYEALGPDDRAKYHAFWNRLNGELDDRSIPKAIGKKLLDLHLGRGDDVWVISKRQSMVPPPAEDIVTRRYERMFGVKLPHPVVQTQLKDKTHFICERRIDIYYGDADTDVTASVGAGATPIRVKRATDSYAKDVVHNGQLGEIVIRDSDR